MAVLGFNCPTDNRLGALSSDVPTTALPTAFRPGRESTDDLYSAWDEVNDAVMAALGGPDSAVATAMLSFAGNAVGVDSVDDVFTNSLSPTPYVRKAPRGLPIGGLPRLGPVLDLGRLMYVNGDLTIDMKVCLLDGWVGGCLCVSLYL